MTRLLAWLAGTLLVLALAAGGLGLAALERQPRVSRAATIAPQAVAQARHLLLRNDPRRLQAGEARQTAIPAELLDEAVNYAATRFLHGRGALTLAERQAQLQLSLSPPWLAGAAYLNITAGLADHDGLPAIDSLRLGALPLPPALAEPLLGRLLAAAGHEREWQLARQAIRSVRFDGEHQRLVVAYVWQPALLERARALAVPPADLALIDAAHRRLAGLLAAHPAGSRVPLASLLAPLLQTPSNPAYPARRAALLVLAAYLAERNLAALLPEAAAWPRLPPVELTLARRYDSAQHFVISAALAAWAGEPLAEAIGTYKELADARHGSGFSFADLAADRAGTAFGELVAADAPALTALLAGQPEDADLLPTLDGLPEYLPQQEFRRRYGGPGQPAYERLLAEIAQRVAHLPLYRHQGAPRP
ncbi:MAG TPA: hypothetical protein VF096_09145 [Azonexus sp.]